MGRIRDRLGFIDWDNITPTPARNGKATAVAESEQKGLTLSGAQFFSPNGRHFYAISDQPSSEVDAVTRHTAFAAAWTCYVALHTLAAKASEPDLLVAEETKDGETWLRSHPLISFLEQPAPSLDMSKLLYRTHLYRHITGQALWIVDINRGGRPARVVVFHGDEFEVQPADGDPRGMFRIHNSGNVYRAAESGLSGRPLLVHWINEDPFNWTRGLSKLDVALAAMNLGQQVQATAKSLLQNALMPSVIIQTHQEWKPTKEEFEHFESLVQAHADLSRKGHPFVLTGGGRATVATFPLKDLVPAELLDRVEAAVAATFGVPAVMMQFLVGLKNSPWSQMEEARRSFYEDTIEPLWVSDEKLLTSRLLRAIDDNRTHRLRFDRTQIRALKTDDTKRAAVAAQMAIAWTVDELRLYTGQEPLPKGDERGAVIPGLQAAPASPEPEPDDDTGENGERSKVARRSSRLQTKDARHDAWLRFDLTAKAQEASWESAVHRRLQADRVAILALADDEGVKAAPDIAAIIRKLLGEIDAYAAAARADWEGVVEPLIDATGTTALRTLSADLGVAFDVLSPALPGYTRSHGAQLVTRITKTTRDALRSTLETGLKNGESIEKLRKRIEDADAAFGRARAELIARTETTTVQNGAQRESMSRYAREESASVTKEWVATQDKRTRDEHAAMDGETVDVDASFSNGLQAPGEPNCRCATIFAIAED